MRQLLTAWGEIRGQTCSVCGARDKFNFSVPDEVWKNVVPTPYTDHVVCLGCFDTFARESGVEYGSHIHTLYFAGDQACFAFSRTWPD